MQALSGTSPGPGRSGAGARLCRGERVATARPGNLPPASHRAGLDRVGAERSSGVGVKRDARDRLAGCPVDTDCAGDGGSGGRSAGAVGSRLAADSPGRSRRYRPGASGLFSGQTPCGTVPAVWARWVRGRRRIAVAGGPERGGRSIVLRRGRAASPWDHRWPPRRALPDDGEGRALPLPGQPGELATWTTAKGRPHARGQVQRVLCAVFWRSLSRRVVVRIRACGVWCYGQGECSTIPTRGRRSDRPYLVPRSGAQRKPKHLDALESRGSTRSSPRKQGIGDGHPPPDGTRDGPHSLPMVFGLRHTGGIARNTIVVAPSGPVHQTYARAGARVRGDAFHAIVQAAFTVARDSYAG